MGFRSGNNPRSFRRKRIVSEQGPISYEAILASSLDPFDLDNLENFCPHLRRYIPLRHRSIKKVSATSSLPLWITTTPQTKEKIRWLQRLRSADVNEAVPTSTSCEDFWCYKESFHLHDGPERSTRDVGHRHGDTRDWRLDVRRGDVRHEQRCYIDIRFMLIPLKRANRESWITNQITFRSHEALECFIPVILKWEKFSTQVSESRVGFSS